MTDLSVLAVGYGLLAAAAWGVGDYVAAGASRRFGGLATGFVLSIISMIIIDAAYVLLWRAHSVFDAPGVLYAAAGGLVYTIATLSFYKALEYGPVSIVSPLGSMYPVVTALTLVAVFGARLGVRQSAGVVIVVTGVLMAAGLFDRTAGRRMGRGPLLAIVAAVCWGAAWALLNRAEARISWQETAVVEGTLSTLGFVPLLPLLKRSEPELLRRLLPGLKSGRMLLAGVLLMIGFLSLTIGVGVTGSHAATAVAVSACYPLITVALALRRLKEAVQPIPLAGAFVGIAGIVVLSLG